MKTNTKKKLGLHEFEAASRVPASAVTLCQFVGHNSIVK